MCIVHTVLQGVVGSTAYGLACDGSDEDRLATHIADVDDFFGLYVGSKTDYSAVSHDPDFTSHEVHKFLRLCLGCNPTVMELLWLPNYDICTTEGEALLGLRHAVLHTTKVRDAYGGYAIQQAQKLVSRKEEGKDGFAADLGHRTAKHGRHCYRLLLAGQHLLKTGQLMVHVGEYRDAIFAAGELAANDQAAFLAMFERAKQELDEVDSVLPSAPDLALVNQTLQHMLKSFYRRHLESERPC